ncbi:hypothetical protein MANAM107_03840 [Actinomyces capricornis]|uniref:Uncharacterized protein n=1 Tax=Actinomyces capricornis TaxID=2755559 RepID=A0ABN6K1Q1_9ACTO|nr:hypothetical protein MANAM107_03840 [Actinomyces capricornis]
MSVTPWHRSSWGAPGRRLRIQVIGWVLMVSSGLARGRLGGGGVVARRWGNCTGGSGRWRATGCGLGRLSLAHPLFAR